MTAQWFDKVLESRIEKTKAILSNKRKEYASGGDRLHNFKRAAAMLGCGPAKALVGMMAKHWISILDVVDDTEKGILPSIPLLEEKLGDACNYIILLEATLKEQIAMAEFKAATGSMDGWESLQQGIDDAAAGKVSRLDKKLLAPLSPKKKKAKKR